MKSADQTNSSGQPPETPAGATSDLDAVLVEHEGDPNAPMVFTVGIVGAILMLALLIFGVVLFQNAQALETENKVFVGKPGELTEQQTLQVAAISQYRYISEPDGIVAIPIDQAIDLFVARIKADPRQASPAGATVEQPTSATSTTHPGSAP
jgi:hypothetical protein